MPYLIKPLKWENKEAKTFAGDYWIAPKFYLFFDGVFVGQFKNNDDLEAAAQAHWEEQMKKGLVKV